MSSRWPRRAGVNTGLRAGRTWRNNSGCESVSWMNLWKLNGIMLGRWSSCRWVNVVKYLSYTWYKSIKPASLLYLIICMVHQPADKKKKWSSICMMLTSCEQELHHWGSILLMKISTFYSLQVWNWNNSHSTVIHSPACSLGMLVWDITPINPCNKQ